VLLDAPAPLPYAKTALPLWPPLLATRGPGARSEGHAHHAMHFVIALDGTLAVRAGGDKGWRRAAGVLTAPDVPHAIDASGVEALLVFFDPESDVGLALDRVLGAPVRFLSSNERNALVAASPEQIMSGDGVGWTERAVLALGGPRAQQRRLHPRVRKLLAHLRAQAVDSDVSLPTLAAAVSLSPGRLMHAFTESVGIPLRPYLLWLKLQRAAALIVSGVSLSETAHAAGFADAAHMSRTFRHMFGVAPSGLRPRPR